MCLCVGGGCCVCGLVCEDGGWCVGVSVVYPWGHPCCVLYVSPYNTTPLHTLVPPRTLTSSPSSHPHSAAGYETIMMNSNPETVSTDYDTSSRLYFEPLTIEDVLNVIEKERPNGIIVQFGGQTPLKLATALQQALTENPIPTADGTDVVQIWGTQPDSIDEAEDRDRWMALLNRLDIKQPPGGTAYSEVEALKVATSLGYPVMVRPSYVLGGRAMEIVYNDDDLRRYIKNAVQVCLWGGLGGAVVQLVLCRNMMTHVCMMTCV